MIHEAMIVKMLGKLSSDDMRAALKKAAEEMVNFFKKEFSESKHEDDEKMVSMWECVRDGTLETLDEKTLFEVMDTFEAIHDDEIQSEVGKCAVTGDIVCHHDDCQAVRVVMSR